MQEGVKSCSNCACGFVLFCFSRSLGLPQEQDCLQWAKEDKTRVSWEADAVRPGGSQWMAVYMMLL